MVEPLPPMAPSGPVAALRTREQGPGEELAAREEATVRIALVIGLSMLAGACLWMVLADPPVLLLLELFGIGAFSTLWSWRQSRKPPDA